MDKSTSLLNPLTAIEEVSYLRHIQSLSFTNLLGDVEYCESDQFMNLGGFLMIYEDQCLITINAHLSDEEKAYGLEYLVNSFAKAANREIGVYLWMRNDVLDIQQS